MKNYTLDKNQLLSLELAVYNALNHVITCERVEFMYNLIMKLVSNIRQKPDGGE